MPTTPFPFQPRFLGPGFHLVLLMTVVVRQGYPKRDSTGLTPAYCQPSAFACSIESYKAKDLAGHKRFAVEGGALAPCFVGPFPISMGFQPSSLPYQPTTSIPLPIFPVSGPTRSVFACFVLLPSRFVFLVLTIPVKTLYLPSLTLLGPGFSQNMIVLSYQHGPS